MTTKLHRRLSQFFLCFLLVYLASLTVLTVPRLSWADGTPEENSEKIRKAIREATEQKTSIAEALAQDGENRPLQEVANNSYFAPCCVHLSLQNAAICIDTPKEEADEVFCRPLQQHGSLPTWDKPERDQEMKSVLEQGLISPEAKYIRGARTVYPYSSDNQYVIYLPSSRISTIQFPHGEFVVSHEISYPAFEAKQVSLDNRNSLENEWTDHISYLTILAKEPSAVSDLRVQTTKRLYSFVLISNGRLHQPLISFEYLDEKKDVVIPAKSTAPRRATTPKPLKVDYSLSGDCEEVKLAKKELRGIALELSSNAFPPSAYELLPNRSVGELLKTNYRRKDKSLLVENVQSFVLVSNRADTKHAKCYVQRTIG